MNAAAVQPLEQAQVVWQRALAIARARASDDSDLPSLDLLRAARHGPSTLLHALALGRKQVADRPDDAPAREAVRFLSRTAAWLGRPVEVGEVGDRS